MFGFPQAQNFTLHWRLQKSQPVLLPGKRLTFQRKCKRLNLISGESIKAKNRTSEGGVLRR